MRADYVLKFREDVHRALWGEERWTVSAHPSSPGVIANGPLAGMTLAEACPGFPLLVKVIDARSRLSVQVHPNERTALLTGGEPKTEMWCMLEDGAIYAGLKPGTTAADVAKAVADGGFEDLLVRHDAKKGDVFFIPGGMVHAIGDGVRLFEVQQSSDTTYRLYDWNRVGADGRPRELHVEKSLRSIDYSLAAPAPLKEVECPFFTFRQAAVEGRLDLPPEESYTVLFAAEGTVSVECAAGCVRLCAGESALVPPGVGAQAAADPAAKVFVSRAPQAAGKKAV